MPYLIMIIILQALVGVAGFKYFQGEVRELQAVNAAYQLRNEEQLAAIQAVQEDFALQTEQLNDLSRKSKEIEAEKERYLSIFKRHDLNKLAYAKPGLIETRVNKGTKNVFDSIENDSRDIDDLDSGVQPDTRDEATTGSQDSNKTD